MMKAAIIGAGFAAEVHVKALRSCGMTAAVVIDKNVERAEAFAKHWNIPVYGGEYDLAKDVDVVHICTPPTIHGEVIRHFLNEGKHILCEKPLCLDSNEAKELEELAEKTEKKCGLIFNVRYHMACQKMKELLASGKFGKPILIHGRYMQEFSAIPAPYDWRYRPAIAGKSRTVTEIGTHWMDLAQFITGEKVASVSAKFGHFFPNRVIKDGFTYPEGKGVEGEPVKIESEDAAIINMTFESGALGNVVLSGVSCGRGNHLSLEVTCEDGNLWWNEEDNNILYSAKKGQGILKEVLAFGNGFSETFAALMEDFYHSIETGEQGIYPTFKDGKLVCRICEAVCESAEKESAWIQI